LFERAEFEIERRAGFDERIRLETEPS
jgi:hypothetical protein